MNPCYLTLQSKIRVSFRPTSNFPVTSCHHTHRRRVEKFLSRDIFSRKINSYKWKRNKNFLLSPSRESLESLSLYIPEKHTIKFVSRFIHSLSTELNMKLTFNLFPRPLPPLLLHPIQSENSLTENYISMNFLNFISFHVEKIWVRLYCFVQRLREEECGRTTHTEYVE